MKKIILLTLASFILVLGCSKKKKNLKFKILAPGYSEEGYLIKPSLTKKNDIRKRK